MAKETLMLLSTQIEERRKELLESMGWEPINSKLIYQQSEKLADT